MFMNLYVMLRSLLLICFFMYSSIQASVENTLDAFVGDSAFFACYLEPNKLKSSTAHWRLNDRLNVYDILQGKGSTKEQDPNFKGRAETFPEEYKKGNFSLTLRSLTSNDVGAYCCFISDASSQQCTILQVKERPRGMKENRADSKAERIASLLLPFFSVIILLCMNADCMLLEF